MEEAGLSVEKNSQLRQKQDMDEYHSHLGLKKIQEEFLKPLFAGRISARGLADEGGANPLGSPTRSQQNCSSR